ncbi:MAG: TlpA disulfide reductase family protein [Gammaproteobacteria bacterium]|nr:TlpA disulfide reductase family protein [Gammaproteobacteria bacterium]
MSRSASLLSTVTLLCLALIGCGIDPNLRYTVTGELGATGEGLENPEIVVRRSTYVEGTLTTEDIASSRVRDGKIDLEGEIHEPTVVRIYLLDGDQAKDSVYAVIEPHAEIRLVDLGKNKGMIADGTGKHAQLVASWMMSDEFVSSLNAYGDSITAWQEEEEAKKKAEEEAEAAADTEAGDSVIESTDDEEVVETAIVAEAGSAKEDAPVVATTDEDALPNACEGDVVEAAAADEEEADRPERYVLYDKVIGIQNDSLDDLARNTEAPLDALLAMELGGLGRVQEGVSRLDELAGVLEEDVVSKRISPRRDRLVAYLKRVDADKSLAPGKFAPDFTLANFDGENVSLNEVLQENEVVLVDFWASWCGPCIATFPELKRMYSDYQDDGFEVVAITIDDTREEWVEATDEHELPWLNLEELQIDGSSGPVYNAYGVTFIPKGYVLNKDSCIVGKDMSMEELDKLLAAQFASVDSTEIDQESTSNVAETTDNQIGS